MHNLAYLVQGIEFNLKAIQERQDEQTKQKGKYLERSWFSRLISFFGILFLLLSHSFSTSLLLHFLLPTTLYVLFCYLYSLCFLNLGGNCFIHHQSFTFPQSLFYSSKIMMRPILVSSRTLLIRLEVFFYYRLFPLFFELT